MIPCTFSLEIYDEASREVGIFFALLFRDVSNLTRPISEHIVNTIESFDRFEFFTTLRDLASVILGWCTFETDC